MVFGDWVQDDGGHLKRSDNYWQMGRTASRWPYLDGAHYRFIQEHGSHV